MIRNDKGEIINISVIGTFGISDLNKEYIMYSMMDDNEDNSLGAVLLGEMIKKENEIQVVGIKDTEKDIVVAYYNEISKQLGGE